MKKRIKICQETWGRHEYMQESHDPKQKTQWWNLYSSQYCRDAVEAPGRNQFGIWQKDFKFLLEG